MTQGEHEETPAQRLAALRELLIHQPPMARELPGFDVAQAPADPAELFVAWLLAAMRGGVPDAQVLTLGTVGLDGTPDARIVTLREVDPDGRVVVHGGRAQPQGAPARGQRTGGAHLVLAGTRASGPGARRGADRERGGGG